LELCILRSTGTNPREPVQIIQENLENIRREASQRYQEELLKIIFGLLEIDPAQRLKVGEAKTKLEEKFRDILTGEFKVSLGLEKEGNELILKEKAKEILKNFEEEKKVIEAKLDTFKASIERLETACNLGMKKMKKAWSEKIEKIKAEKNKNVEEMIKTLEDKIQTLKQENQDLLETVPNQAKQPIEAPCLNQRQYSFPTKVMEISKVQRQDSKLIDAKESRIRLKKVVAELKKKWGRWFDFDTKGQNDLSIKAWGIKDIDDKVFQGVVKDLIQEWEKESLWKELDKLEIVMNEENQITDEGLKEFTSQLGPRFLNVQHLELGMKNWDKITNEGLEVLASELLSRLTNVKKLVLNMNNWNKITNSGFAKFTNHFGPQFTNLQHLELYIGK